MMFGSPSMLSIRSEPTVVASQKQRLKVLYRELSTGGTITTFSFQVAGESGRISLPAPEWFREDADRFRIYTDAVVLGMVTRFLREKNYSTFDLEISR